MWPDDKTGTGDSVGAATHAVDILAFVDARQMPARYLDLCYQLAPAPGGERLYAMLRETLKSGGMIGIACVLIEARQQLAALAPQGDRLMLHTLRWEGEPAHGERQAVSASADVEPDDIEAALQALVREQACGQIESGNGSDLAFCADMLADELAEGEEDEMIDRALASILDLRRHADGRNASRRRRGGQRQRSGWLRPRSRLLS